MTREQTTIRLPAELKRELQREADERGISFNAYIVIILQQRQVQNRGYVRIQQQNFLTETRFPC